MSTLRVGTYVVHAKLPELGTGEIVSSDGQCFGIRFASGQRNFVCALTEKHLSVTAEAPPVSKPTRSSKPRAARASKAKAAAPAPAAVDPVEQ